MLYVNFKECKCLAFENLMQHSLQLPNKMHQIIAVCNFLAALIFVFECNFVLSFLPLISLQYNII